MLDSLTGEEWDVKVSKIANIFFREKKDVLCYIKSAQYIECLLNWAGMDRKKFFKEKKVSSLEQQFVKKFINEYKSDYYENILSFNLNQKSGGYELTLKDNNIDKSKLSKFILDSSEILFNTRTINYRPRTRKKYIKKL
ncbi:hypothetical protein ASO20_02240 [Mycoplasma sp. (ex Biomphalaria glabrata)]|uniref:hypothetical protein n=1 Tax=Mycoplasma sp. (ex Biomphalaria glabrata) TaxID=1749074 RepID=UPI00073A821D|nr:hypothetical protein [Mycoplasma sp. (ex Biomphalaria glabrata)]ALV23457.1 hypothetical protein ASO20_02240 [Mycoplasma sp. (ex Biomphalaria glabrata)]